MVQYRHVRWSRYGVAFLATILIIGLVILTTVVVDSLRVQEADVNARELRTNYESLQFQYAYLSTVMTRNDSCPALSSALGSAIKQLSVSLEQVEHARERETTGITFRELKLIERQYLIDNLRYWLISKKAKEACSLDIVPLLYFTSTDDCSECARQGAVLTYFKKKLGERFLVFPLNVVLEDDEPMLSILRAQYGIKSIPSVVIDDEVFSTVLSRDDLEKVLLRKYFDSSGVVG